MLARVGVEEDEDSARSGLLAEEFGVARQGTRGHFVQIFMHFGERFGERRESFLLVDRLLLAFVVILNHLLHFAFVGVLGDVQNQMRSRGDVEKYLLKRADSRPRTPVV